MAHNALSKVLTHQPIQHYIGICCEETWPTAARTIDAMTRWSGSQEASQTGFILANGIGGTYWDAVRRDLARAQRFADFMHFFQPHPSSTPLTSLIILAGTSSPAQGSWSMSAALKDMLASKY